MPSKTDISPYIALKYVESLRHVLRQQHDDIFFDRPDSVRTLLFTDATLKEIALVNLSVVPYPPKALTPMFFPSDAQL